MASPPNSNLDSEGDGPSSSNKSEKRSLLASASKRKQPAVTLLNFFKKSKSSAEETDSGTTTPEKDTTDTPSTSTTPSHFQQPADADVSAEVLDHSLQIVSLAEPSQSEFSSDIGRYIGKMSEIDDSTKRMLLENPWTPPPDYIFPHSVKKMTVGGVVKEYKKFAQRSHLEKYFWLVLSPKDQGLYCKYCAIFVTSGTGDCQSSTSLGRLVRTPLRSFDDLLGQKGALESHAKCRYHTSSVEAGKNFLLTYHRPQLEVHNQVSSQRQRQVEENRCRLRPIVSTVIFCGRQNLPLRGHRDDGALSLPDTEDSSSKDDDSVRNEGNFRALLQFRVSAGDEVLKQHLQTTGHNATYISKTTQNHIIDCCKEEIQHAILLRVKEARFYAIIFDETTDISRIEQLSLSFRYLHEEKIREDVTFADVYQEIRPEDEQPGGERKLTGVAIAHIVEDLLEKFNIDLLDCVGVGHDSCYVLSSEVKGAIQELLKKMKNARSCPCANHVLNNSLAKTSTVSACRNATGTIKATVAFANASAKRTVVFKEEMGGKSMKRLCETRWAEKHEGHLDFKDNIEEICRALEKISTWEARKTASEAYCLLQAIRSAEFVVALVCLCDILGTTAPLSRQLQSPSLDLKNASESVSLVHSVLQKKRENAEKRFETLFKEADSIARKLTHVEEDDGDSQSPSPLTVPRRTAKQQHRENHPSSSAEEYFRRSIYIPLLDGVLRDMDTRFSADMMGNFDLRLFLPQNTSSESEIDANTDDDLEVCRRVVSRYKTLLPVSPSSVENEYILWKEKWNLAFQKKIPVPNTGVELYMAADKDLFPGIRVLLQILATLPISVATAERSFSTLRRLKTWVRSRMGEERLVGLALLHVHRDIPVSVDAVIDRFAKSKRRLDFVL